MKKILKNTIIVSMSALLSASAFADPTKDNPIGGTFGTDYSYANWTQGGTDTFSATGNSLWINIGVGAGSSYTVNAFSLDASGSIYLYGTSSDTATFVQSGAAAITIAEDLILNYGTYNKSGSSTLSVDEISMDNDSHFSTLAGSVTSVDFTVGTDSTVSLGGGTATGTLTISDTMTLNSNASVNTVAGYNNTSKTYILNTTTIANLVMNDTSTYKMEQLGILNIGNSLTMNGGTFSNTVGTLTFNSGSTIVMNGGSFSSEATILEGNGTISLALASVELSGETATATILGSIDLGTVDFSSDGVWTIALDVSNVLDGFDTNFEMALSDLITIDNANDTNIAISLVNSDSYTASLSGATVSFTYVGAAVPEPSTYAMIFGVVALGFAAYRRRK